MDNEEILIKEFSTDMRYLKCNSIEDIADVDFLRAMEDVMGASRWSLKVNEVDNQIILNVGVIGVYSEQLSF